VRQPDAGALSSRAAAQPEPDPFRELAAPRGARGDRSGGEPPGEKPVPAQPTASWAYRWLGIGVLAGTAAAVGVAAATTAVTGSWLAAYGSSSALIGAAVVAGLRGVWPIITNQYLGRWLDESAGSWRAHERVCAAVMRLTARAGISEARVVGSDKVRNMGMIDPIGVPNTLIYNPHYVEQLAQPELEAVVAHELSHGDRLSTVGRLAVLSLSRMSTPMTLAGVLAWYAGSGGGIIASSAVAVGATWAVSTVLRGLRNVASRAGEMRTDIRAVELTGDLESMVRALKVTYEASYQRLPKFIPALQPFSSHPSLAMRERWLRRACGSPEPAPESSAPDRTPAGACHRLG